MFKGSSAKDSSPQSNQINRLIEGTTINGDLSTEGNIRIDGTVKGNLSVKGKLVLGQNGHIEGDVKCLNADIEGSIKGNILVDGLLILKDTANIEGTITTHKIGILEGAQFTGNCIMSPEASQPIQKNIVLEEDQDTEMVY